MKRSNMTEITQEQEDQLILTKAEELRSNFPLYAWINMKIKNKQAQIVRLLFNKLQRKLWQLIKEDLKKGIPLRYYFIKSRQTGSTTFWLSLFFWLTTLWKNRNAVFLAQDDQTSQAIGDKFQNLYLRSNPRLKPNARKMNRAEVYFANSLDEYEKTGDIGHDSHIDNQTANKANLGRSYTYQLALLTEFGVWEENGIDHKQTLSPLLQTIPKLPNTAIIIETTAKGEGYAKDFWDDKFNGFKKIFISWIADDDYRVDLPFGMYYDLHNSEDARYGDEMRIKDIIEKELVFWDPSNTYKDNPLALHHEAFCRIAWRRETIDEKCFGDLTVFRQEYPLTVEDAFATSGSTVFNIKSIERQEKIVKDNNIKPETYSYQHNDGIIDAKRKFYADRYGKLKIFEHSEPGIQYVIAGDGSQGIEGGDPSSLFVMRLPEMYEVASYEDIIQSSDFAGVSYYLSELYNRALLGIEINDKGGYATIEHILDKYPKANLYFQRRPKSNEIQYGWTTNGVTRSVMIGDLKSLLYYDQIQIYNEETHKQLRYFIRHKNGKLGAVSGKHDDLVIAAMIAIQIAQTLHTRVNQPRPQRSPKGSLDWLLREMEKRRSDSSHLRVA